MAQKQNNFQPYLVKKYKSEVSTLLSKRLGIKNVMRLPKIEKIVLNMGIGDASNIASN